MTRYAAGMSYKAEILDSKGNVIGHGVIEDDGSGQFVVTRGYGIIHSVRCEELGLTMDGDDKEAWLGDTVTLPPWSFR